MLGLGPSVQLGERPCREQSVEDEELGKSLA
jgi:hypothetical protein